METLQKFMPWRNVRNHRFWRKVCTAWHKIIFSHWIIAHDFSSSEYEEWNPWKDWCDAWEEFDSTEEKPPKSERKRADVFSELFRIAKLTSDKLEKAKATRTENESLKNHNSVLQRTCKELQYNLEKEVNRRKTLEVEKETLKSLVQWKEEEHQQEIREERMFQKETLKSQVQQKEKEHQHFREELMFEKKSLKLLVQRKEEELQRFQAECRELKTKISSFESQLMECRNKYNYQIIIKNDINVFPQNKRNQRRLHAQLENGEQENVLDPDSIRDIIEGLGQPTRLNLFDWLCKFEVECILSKWSGKDIEHILRRCMDFNNCSSLLPMLKMGQTTWLGMYKQIAECFFPDLDDMMDTEQMRRGDNVLDYFNRMWMIYRIKEYPDDVCVNDPEYKNAICEGLLPHLYNAVQHFHVEDYRVIEKAAISVEKLMKAGAGCPSRMEIWNRLQKHNPSFDEIDNSTYWELVAYLSRYEDLITEEPR